VYALLIKGDIVYIGKASKGTTKSQRSLRHRLNEHVKKIQGRKNIRLEDVQVQYMTLDSEWWVFAAEFALVSYYKPKLNMSGFGSKTPGRGRPGTDRISDWDRNYPPK
jgi:hypothetical protein